MVKYGLSPRDFLRAVPFRISLRLRPYFTVYPYLSPNTNIITFLTTGAYRAEKGNIWFPRKYIVKSLRSVRCQIREQREYLVPYNPQGTYGVVCSIALTGQLHLFWKIILTLQYEPPSMKSHIHDKDVANQPQYRILFIT